MSGAAGSGLLLPSLDDLIDAAGRRAGIHAVLDAADKLHGQLEDAEYRASFAPAPTFYAQCVCGSVMTVHGELDEDDREAIRDWDDTHAYCQQGAL